MPETDFFKLMAIVDQQQAKQAEQSVIRFREYLAKRKASGKDDNPDDLDTSLYSDETGDLKFFYHPA